MITLTLQSFDQTIPLELPTCWEEIDFGTFCELHSKEKPKELEILSILSGVSLDVLQRCDYDALMRKAVIVIKELYDQLPAFYEAYGTPKEKINIAGKEIALNFGVEKQTAGQFYSVTDLQRMYDDPNNKNAHVKAWPYIIATYTQPQFDAPEDTLSQWKAGRGQGYDADRSMWLAENYIKKLPVTEVYGAAVFFYLKLSRRLINSVHSLSQSIKALKPKQASKRTRKSGDTSQRQKPSPKKKTSPSKKSTK